MSLTKIKYPRRMRGVGSLSYWSADSHSSICIGLFVRVGVCLHVFFFLEWEILCLIVKRGILTGGELNTHKE